MTLDRQSDLLERQLNTLIGLYEHHLDLFLKWMTLYVTVVGGVAVYIFNQEIDAQIRQKLPLVIGAGSFIVSLGCLIMWNWLKKLEKEVKDVSDKLGEGRYPSLLGITMTIVAFAVTLVFSLISVLYSIYGKF